MSLSVLRLVRFMVADYARSGRLLVELVATAIAYYLLFRRVDAADNTAMYFFATAGLLALLLTLYTAQALLAQAVRAEYALVLTRRVGRGTFLVGVYMAALAVVAAMYGALSLATAVFSPVSDLTLAGWLLGSLPLLLNVAQLAALLALASPLALSSGGRLAILGLILFAFSTSLIGGPALAALPTMLVAAIEVVRTIVSAPLIPGFSGYALAVSRDYGGLNAAIPLAQALVTLALLALAVVAFRRREIQFTLG